MALFHQLPPTNHGLDGGRLLTAWVPHRYTNNGQLPPVEAAHWHRRGAWVSQHCSNSPAPARMTRQLGHSGSTRLSVCGLVAAELKCVDRPSTARLRCGSGRNTAEPALRTEVGPARRTR